MAKPFAGTTDTRLASLKRVESPVRTLSGNRGVADSTPRKISAGLDRQFPPAGHHLLDLGSDMGSRFQPVHATHQQLVVGRVHVSNCGGYGEVQRLRVEIAPSRGATDPPAAPSEGVVGDLLGSILGAAGVVAQDLGYRPLLEFRVSLSPALLFAQLTPRSRLLVRQAFALGAVERILLDQDTLPLVPAPGSAEAHDHRREDACPFRPARERGVAGRQVDEMVEVGAAQAEGTSIVHRQEVAGAGALGAGPALQRRDHHQVLRLVASLCGFLGLRRHIGLV